MAARRGFGALASPRLRVYLAGQVVSMAGSSVQQIATAWLAYRVSGSSAVVGATVLLTQLPILLLAPFAGALSDSCDRRRLLLITQLAGALQAVCFALAITLRPPTVPLLFSYCAALGVINALDTPVRQAIVAGLVERRDDIRSAVALSAAGLHLARFVGAAAAALLLARFGEATGLFVNAASYLAAFGALLAIGPDRGSGAAPSGAGRTLRDGMRFASRDSRIRPALLLVAVVSLAVMPYPTLLPAALHAAADIAARDYARLLVWSGAGAIGGALLVACWPDDRSLKRAIPLSLLVAGGCVAILRLSLEHGPPAAAWIALMIAGLTLTIVVSGSNALIQHAVPDALRGRVMGLFALAFNGVMPLGALSLGAAADAWGPQRALEIAAVCALLIGLAAGGGRSRVPRADLL